MLEASSPAGFLLLALVGAVASGINAVAGGGSLVSFPTLTLGYGVPSLHANATNSVALWPGSLSGAIGFLNHLEKTRHALRYFVPPTVLGALAGAWLLVSTPQRAFDVIVPWLVLLATLVLALQPRIRAYLARRHGSLPVWWGIALQFLVSVYGGYFGAGMGIMMLGAFALVIEGNVHELNALKGWLGLLINLAATAVFVARGLVLWIPFAALVVGAVVGGYAAARLSQRIDAEKMRIAIVAYGLVMSAVFFMQLR